MSPPSPSIQLVTIFSPTPNDPHSGRTTPSSVGEASSGRALALTVDSSGAILSDTLGPPNLTIHLIPRQGLFVVIDAEGLASRKSSGGEKGATTYSSVEHVTLLSVISQVPYAFNCSESSPQREEVYKRMIAEIYQSGPTWLSGALHGNFADLYSAFKVGIRNWSIVHKEKKCPVEYKAGDDAMAEYMEALNNLLCSDAKKYNSKKWWSRGVVELLLPMHLAYTSEFSGGPQTAGWLSDKVTAHKMKFETDQKNWLNELAKKRKAEEEERIDVAKNRKAVAEASAQLVQAFQKFSTPPAQPEKVGAIVEQKLATMKTEIMQEIGVKMEESSKEVKDTLASILGLLQNRN